MTKKVPFIANHKDNMHCVMAAFRMVYQYYLGKDLTWKQIDKIAHTIKGKGSWTFPLELDLSLKGIDVLNIEPVDYSKLYKFGESYLTKAVGKETANYYLKQTNIANVLDLIPRYIQNVKHITRKGKINEIISFLKRGYLVQAEVNASILDNYEGFDLHTILLYDFDGVNLIAHDPGLPPRPERKITLDEFTKCFAYEGASQAIVVFKGLKKV